MIEWENILKLTLLCKCSEWMKCWYLFCTWTEYREETRVVRNEDVKHLKTWSVFTLDVTWHGGGLLLARFPPPTIFFFCHFVQCLLRKNGCDGWFWQVVFPVTFENSLISACYQNTRFMTSYASSWTFLYFYPTRNDNSKKLQKHLEHRSFTLHFPLAICNAG